MSQPAQDSLLTPGQMGKALGTTNKTILEWFHAGKIPAEVAEGAVYRFDPAKVKEALAERAADAAAKKKKAQRAIDRPRGGRR